MPTVEITKDNFEQTITDNDIVVVDFWAEWCGPCRSFAPTFESSSSEHPDVVHGKVDTEDQQELASYFNIRSIPTLMAFREQVLLFSQPGALPAEALEDLLTQVKALDMEEVHTKVAAAAAADHADHDHEDAEHAGHDH